MSEQHYSISQDLDEAQVMANGLEDYLTSSELYGKTGGFFSKTPSLTIGALLMRLRRLRALQDRMNDAQRGQFAQIDAKHAQISKEWAIHYHEKLAREALSRLDQMKHFFEECKESPRSCAAAYPTEALRRTIVQEAARALESGSADDSRALRVKLAEVDSSLRRYAQPEGFQWDAALQPAYPQDEFWWLYARPSGK